MAEQTFRFDGFDEPNYTMVPDQVFDVLLPELSLPELKVLLYITRRTFGFKKRSDSISLNQLISGITTRDGRVLDRGTGLSRSSVRRGISGLLEKGAIVAIQNSSPERGSQPTTYALRFKGDVHQRTPGRPADGHGGDSPSDTPPVQSRHPQERVKQHTESDLSNAVNSSKKDVIDEDAVIIKRIGLELARELGDEAPAGAIESRVVRLWQLSGKGRADFVKDLYEARRRTRLYQGRQPPGIMIRSKPAYFFTVLEDLS